MVRSEDGDHVVAAAAADPVDLLVDPGYPVAARPAAQVVAPAARFQPVLSGTAEKQVGSPAADQPVVAALTAQHVGTRQCR